MRNSCIDLYLFHPYFNDELRSFFQNINQSLPKFSPMKRRGCYPVEQLRTAEHCSSWVGRQWYGTFNYITACSSWQCEAGFVNIMRRIASHTAPIHRDFPQTVFNTDKHTIKYFPTNRSELQARVSTLRHDARRKELLLWRVMSLHANRN